MTLDRPPLPPRPWWHIRPTERKPLAWILGVGGPAGFALGALLGLFLQVPGPPLPQAGRGMPGVQTSSVAPPATTVSLSPARPNGTGSDVAPRRAATRDATRPAVASPPRRVDTPTTATAVRAAPATTPTVTTTVRATVRAVPVATPVATPPRTTTHATSTPATSTTTPPPSTTPTGTKDPGPAPGKGMLDQAREPPGGSGREPTP